LFYKNHLYENASTRIGRDKIGPVLRSWPSPMKPMQPNERSVSVSHEFKREFGFPLPITLSKLIA